LVWFVLFLWLILSVKLESTAQAIQRNELNKLEQKSQMPWYAVSTKPHQERLAELHIQRFDIECFLPLLKETKIIRRTRKMVIEPLFPGYLFARFDLDKHYRAVNYARGVRKIVEFGSGPVELDATMIEAIKEELSDGYVMPHSDHLKMGQLLHINGGPLAGLEAVFMRKMTGRNRVLLFLKTLGFHARLTVGIDQVSLV
jgi:transcriptional antiterminator RfaH